MTAPRKRFPDPFDIENDWLDHALMERAPDPQPEDNWPWADPSDDDDGDDE
jgi:hypothetical protein